MKCIKVRVEIKRPKRKSGVYIKELFRGLHLATRRIEDGAKINYNTFLKYQLEEGPYIFGGLNYKLIPYQWK